MDLRNLIIGNIGNKLRLFKIIFLTCYAVVTIGVFLLTLVIVGNLETLWCFSAPSLVKKLLIVFITVAGFVSIFNPLVLRRFVFKQGKITRLGRWIILSFGLSEEHLPQAFSVPWIITILAGIIMVVANLLISL